MKCFLCVDYKLYFISYDGVNCHKNDFPNCLIASDTIMRAGGSMLTSINYRFTPINTRDGVATRCLRCAEGFIYQTNFNRCAPSTDYDETIVTIFYNIINLGKNKQPNLN